MTIPEQKKVVVITGASSGFGRGIALALAGQGASVVLAARRKEVLDQLAIACEAQGGQALAVCTDVSKSDEVETLAVAAETKFGRIDAWINNAGVGAIGRFDQVPLDDHAQVIATNLLGTLFGSYAALRRFRDQKAGILINIASMLGKIPSAYYSSYNASKNGVVGLTDTLRHEIELEKADHIHVCMVLPMAMNTPFFSHAANYTGHEAVPIPPVSDAQHVVDAVIGMLAKPQAEIIVGAGGTLSNLAHRLMPDALEMMSSKITAAAQLGNQTPAAATSGSVHHPVTDGIDLHGTAKPTF